MIVLLLHKSVHRTSMKDFPVSLSLDNFVHSGTIKISDNADAEEIKQKYIEWASGLPKDLYGNDSYLVYEGTRQA